MIGELLMVSNCSLPLINKSYRGSIFAADRLSGAGESFLALLNFNFNVLFLLVAIIILLKTAEAV